MDNKYPLALRPGTVLNGEYTIKRVLGQGGFGITYEASDNKNGESVAIKEYLPEMMAARSENTVVPFSGERGENFSYGKECFLEEAKTLSHFIGHLGIVGVKKYFEENGTAYFVMEYIQGKSFKAYLEEKGGKIPVEEAIRIFVPVMDALSSVHATGMIHRDVTPDNIYITDRGQVRLLDFGAARYSVGDRSMSLDVVLKHGFAPKEQYTRHGRQGPYTDIYSLAATMYRAITGTMPQDAIDRIENDELKAPSVLGIEITEWQERALLKALAVDYKDRYQSIDKFKTDLFRKGTTANAERIGIPEAAHQEGSVTAPQKKVLPVVITVLILLVAAGTGIGVMTYNRSKVKDEAVDINATEYSMENMGLSFRCSTDIDTNLNGDMLGITYADDNGENRNIFVIKYGPCGEVETYPGILKELADAADINMQFTSDLIPITKGNYPGWSVRYSYSAQDKDYDDGIVYLLTPQKGDGKELTMLMGDDSGVMNQILSTVDMEGAKKEDLSSVDAGDVYRME